MPIKASPAKAKPTSPQLELVGVKAAGPNSAALPRLAYTLRETAQILGISYISVYRLVERRKLKASTALPGRKLIPAREIESFLIRTAA